MTRYFISFIIAGLALTFLACEDAMTREFEVNHDCTGSYLVQPGGDLKVCNKEILESFSSGDFVNATYRITSEAECPEVNNFLCLLFHPYSAVIHIDKVEHD